MQKFIFILALITLASFGFYSQNSLDGAFDSNVSLLDASLNGFTPALEEKKILPKLSTRQLSHPILAAKSYPNISVIHKVNAQQSARKPNIQEDFKRRVLSQGKENQQLVTTSTPDSEPLLNEQIAAIKEKNTRNNKPSRRPNLAMGIIAEKPEILPDYFKKPENSVIVIYETHVE
ncbi:MAG: hypothetical protein KBD78_01755 [Oligoflexales bacterium]|nr:hypothetical protein [Oligoflexales bacterium]